MQLCEHLVLKSNEAALVFQHVHYLYTVCMISYVVQSFEAFMVTANRCILGGPFCEFSWFFFGEILLSSLASMSHVLMD